MLDIRPLNWDEIIEEDDDNENWADRGSLGDRSTHPGDENHHHDGKGQVNKQGGVQWTRKGKGTQDENGKGKATEDEKGRGKGLGMPNGERKGIVILTPGGDVISHAIDLLMHMEM